MKSREYPKKAAHQAPAPATPEGYRRRRGFKGFVDTRALARVQEERAQHQAIMGERPRGYVRGMADFSAAELAVLQAKLQRWVQEGTR